VSELVLASASPRRADLLQRLGVTFQVHSADIDESLLADENPEHYVARMAREKSARVQQLLGQSTLAILAADTSVVLDGMVLGKPRDALDALAMLARLSGREHRVLSAVCLRRGDLLEECTSDTRVQFLTLNREQCEAYIARAQPFDKAGGYAIQGLAAAFVERINGSYSGVVGLPLAETWQLLSRFGVATALEQPNGE
jgi:septum formation protein